MARNKIDHEGLTQRIDDTAYSSPLGGLPTLEPMNGNQRALNTTDDALRMATIVADHDIKELRAAGYSLDETNPLTAPTMRTHRWTRLVNAIAAGAEEERFND